MAGCAGCARLWSCSSPTPPKAGRLRPGRGTRTLPGPEGGRLSTSPSRWPPCASGPSCCCCASPASRPGTLSTPKTRAYLFDALEHPWHLLVPYGGYEELMPRLVGQLISYLPLVDVAVPFALAGAGIAALCALFIYHALDGWIQSRWLR